MRALLLFVICIGHALSVYSQESAPPVRNFTTKEYGRDFHPSNTSVIQDSRGLIYSANGFMLLEYDGNTWNSCPSGKKAWILSLASDSKGIIYAGSQNEFGYFAPDMSGRMAYSSLSDSLGFEDMDFTNVWKVHCLDKRVLFQSEEKIFIYDSGKLSAIKPSTSFHLSFVVNGTFYVRERSRGLMKLAGEKLSPVEGSDIFEDTGIFMMVPLGMGRILIGTRGMGLWIYDPACERSKFSRIYSEDESYIERSVITGGVLTSSGNVAVGTMLNGIIMIDQTGKVLSVINRKKGLNDNEIKEVITDQTGNLWAATNNGVSTVGITSPLSLYNEKDGIGGSINAITRFRENLYAGTNEGLFAGQKDKTGDLYFKPVPGISSSVRSLAKGESSMFIGTDNGIYETQGTFVRKLSDNISYALFYEPVMNLLFSGGRGIGIYSVAGGRLQKRMILNNVTDDIVGFAALRSGDTLTLWAGTMYTGALKIKFLKSKLISCESFGTADGLPEGPVIPLMLNDNIAFGTGSGLFSFTDEKDASRNLPDSLKGNSSFTKGYFTGLKIKGDSTLRSVNALAEADDRIWICSGNIIGYYSVANGLKYISGPFAGIDAGKINVIYPENRLCWFGTSEGLIRYDGSLSKNYYNGYNCLIRKIELIDTDSAIFSVTGKPVLPYSLNSIRLKFSAPFYEYPEKITYSYQLDNSRWSAWQNSDYQEFTNLKEGNHVFRVKAVNAYGNQSSVAEYHFSVLPPWYRSAFAILVYILIGSIAVWLIAWANSYRLKRDNLRLEGIVAERTAEVVQQKEEIENKNKVLEHQHKEIEDSIKYAKRIQSAVIPPENLCAELLPASFIFFRPLNIVSGDFYWINKVDGKTIFTAADCTGHGVPGAFMSMLGMAFLNEIVGKDHITEPDQILNSLRNKVVQSLQHKGYSGETRDGMDISLICIDNEHGVLKYAGAYNSLIMIRDNEVKDFPADKMPVGFYEKMDPFNLHEISILKGDVFYLSSDGYEDQFGGPDGKKLKSKKFRQILLEIHKLPMTEQKELLERRFEEWKGDQKQIDDIVVAGIKIN